MYQGEEKFFNLIPGQKMSNFDNIQGMKEESRRNSFYMGFN